MARYLRTKKMHGSNAMGNRLLNVTKLFNVFIVVSLLAALLIFPQASFGEEQSIVIDESLTKQKVPARVLQKLEAGQFQEVIVEFEHQDIRAEAAVQRQARRLKFNNNQIIAYKAARYLARKKRVFDAIRVADFKTIRDYKHLPLAFVRVKSKRAAERLGSLPEVKAIHLNQVFYPHLTESLPFINQPDLCACGYGGGDMVVAVLDTGVDYTRQAFGSCSNAGEPGCKVIAAYEAAIDDGLLDDSAVFHGTNVAGIVLGVAPDSHITAVDVFNGETASSTDIIAGINWVIDQKNHGIHNTAAINLSLGAPASPASICNSSPLRTAIQNAQSVGIITIASAGNDGFINEIGFPACIPEVTSVGAVYDSNIGGVAYSNCTDNFTAPDQVTCFSNSSSELAFLAPGAGILASGVTLFGTSQAAPHVSGAIAILRSAFPLDSLDETLLRLQNMGLSVTDSRNGLTTPRLSFQGLCQDSDEDNDCIADSIDNCPSNANPNQEDSDTDGLGDICDECPNDAQNDLDGDTICGDIDLDDDGDGMPDAWELNYVGLNPLVNDADEDLDGDGFTNLEEYTAGTNPADETSLPYGLLEVIPHQNAGISPDQTRVANDTSFSVRIYSMVGVNIADLSSIKFTINDGSGNGYNPYVRDLGDNSVVRVIKLNSGPDSDVKSLWAVYDRSKEATYGNYAYDVEVNIIVDVNDKNGISLPQANYEFKIESETEHNQARFYQPPSGPVDPDDPGLTGPYNMGIQVNGGNLDGAKIIFNDKEPVAPRFGPEGELQPYIVEGEEVVGVPMNLQPPNVFNTPVKVFVPCPGFSDVSRIKLYLYNGTAWVPALDEDGGVMPGGKHFIVPNTRVNHNNGAPSTIEIQIYHFSALQAASATGGANVSSTPPNSTGGGGGGCFIDSIKNSFGW